MLFSIKFISLLIFPLFLDYGLMLIPIAKKKEFSMALLDYKGFRMTYYLIVANFSLAFLSNVSFLNLQNAPTSTNREDEDMVTNQIVKVMAITVVVAITIKESITMRHLLTTTTIINNEDIKRDLHTIKAIHHIKVTVAQIMVNGVHSSSEVDIKETKAVIKDLIHNNHQDILLRDLIKTPVNHLHTADLTVANKL